MLQIQSHTQPSQQKTLLQRQHLNLVYLTIEDKVTQGEGTVENYQADTK